jgi:hypothetical protein
MKLKRRRIDIDSLDSDYNTYDPTENVDHPSFNENHKTQIEVIFFWIIATLGLFGFSILFFGNWWTNVKLPF